ncbi:serine/threonine-protein kinase MPS1-like isoform X1 [Musa acuminata AAA Group]|uniref:serine/threonine-protein kinase MPS1-like isoform X1 n=1 Tax=Musa acuminata AAA Group TaxID=214697 RepID=UPI0031D9AD9E
MDRKANLQARPASDRPSAADANFTHSSSSSSCTFSPPEFLRQAHAVFKRHRRLGGMESKICRATRVLVPQTEPSDSMASMSTLTTNETAKAVLPTGSVVGVRRLVKAPIDQRENRAIAVAGLLEDASINPPSVTETLTVAGDDKASSFGLQKSNFDLMADRKQSSLVVMSSQVSPPHALMDNDMKKEILTFQSTHLNTDGKMETISSFLHSLALTGVESYLGTQVGTNDQDLKLQNHGNLEVFGTSMKFGGTSMLENTKEPKHDQCYVEPMARCSVLDSSCVTSLSVNTGPTFQSTHAQPAGKTSFLTQVSSSAKEVSSSIKDHVPMEELGAIKNGCDWDTDRQHNLHLAESVKEKGLCGYANYLPSQAPLTNNPSSNIEVCPSQSSKVEKSRQKKKYDPTVFFKVNGKLYQKLGKIGSGGSSEVHKVISSDCTIYALKKIRLRGRDYPTAYGFCQEIEYLNKLKGKSNIIQLIDYEVTDKTLFQEVADESVNIKDKRVKDDECIYMVLEYGEIDLAHMLSQKWKEINTSGCKIDENWLRFYWQQMLEAVNTIHEERIVHSDLKPANFLLVRGSLKLIDFGIAKAIMSDTTNIQRDAQVGTLNYMSPEAFMCNECDSNGNIIKCGRPSDIWSLGCILYQMVYGKTPFAEYKTFWAKFKVVTDRNHEVVYERVSNPWLIDLMRRCLAWDRNERWRIPQLLQHPFLVPRMPRELPPLDDNHPCKLLVERIGTYWSNPEVSRLCLELHEVIIMLEKVQKSPNVCVEPNGS